MIEGRRTGTGACSFQWAFHPPSSLLQGGRREGFGGEEERGEGGGGGGKGNYCGLGSDSAGGRVANHEKEGQAKGVNGTVDPIFFPTKLIYKSLNDCRGLKVSIPTRA